MITITETNDAAETEIVIRDDRNVKWKRANGTEIHSLVHIMGTLLDHGFKFVADKGTRIAFHDEGTFLLQEAIYTGPRDGLAAALERVTVELGEECISEDGYPCACELRIAHKGEADAYDAAYRARVREEDLMAA